ncbi:MAG: multiheme c-type cytochrome [Verrucomicrobiota bacterium]
MKIFDYYRMRRALAVLTAGLAIGGIVGSASGQQPPMYRMSLSADGGIGSGGGVPAQALQSLPVVNGTNVTLNWYGLEGWYTIQGATSVAGPWNNLTSVEASGYSWQATLPYPDTTNGYSLFQLSQANSFAGSSACGGCHGAQYIPFTTTAHANAYNALVSSHMNNNAECILCHTVGNTQPTGFTASPLTANLEGVGCEDCHGAAAWHKNGDHSAVVPVLSIDPMICGSCHNGFNPQYNEYTNSPHYLVNDTINYGVENGVYYTNTAVIGSTTYYGYYVTTNANGTLKTNATSGIFSSSHVPGSSVDPGDDRQTSCGVCHSGAARMAMINDYAARQAGITNPLVLPLAADAGAWGPTCADCHDPHGLNPSPILGTVTNIIAGVSTNIGLAVVGTNWVQLRNPLWSSNFFTMASQSDKRYDSMGNPYYMNTTFSSMYDPTINVCAQCHNTRGARWDGRGYGLITNTYEVTNLVISAAYTNSYTTNYNIYGQIVGVTTNTSPTGGVVTNAVPTSVLVAATGLTTVTNGFGRQPHLSPQYNMLIGILQPDYLNSTNGSTVYTNGILNNGIGIYATHSGIKNRSVYNTNQCATCHVPSYSGASGNVSGHTFQMDPNGCALGGCHTSGAPDYPDYQIEQTNLISSDVDLLNRWATNNAPAIFTNYSKYQLDSWEYTLPGSLGVQGGAGPSTSDQLLLPAVIQQARFDVYMVAGDGSLGVHNPTFIPLLLKDAETKVLSQFVTAKFTAKATYAATNANVTFTNLNPNLISATWSFGDGTTTNTTTTSGVNHMYPNPGAYTVSLTATDINTNTETLTRNNYVHIYTLATPSFTYGITSLTTNLATVSFTNTSLNADYGSWSFYDSTGTISSAHKLLGAAGVPTTIESYTYTNSGSFPVVLSASTPAGSASVTNSITITIP